ncbi:hypothetical protein ONA70_01735 [Micromonospora yasonensis]|uniref:hypothetical protein n=1 Tax=Micromonospora yasonensis TaxID=1128667 RepID=UPI00222E516D|nr:hypothetical protein [Micromonospora yasonensis]MCW3838820.1 hypothetical protein [Micromonospora yasonensis]
MSSYARWQDIRAAQVERAEGERALEEGKNGLVATVVVHRITERRSCGNGPPASR